MTRICVTYAKLKRVGWKKKLFENGVLLTGDKNFLYIRMKKMVITKTSAKPYLVLAYNFQTAQ